MDDGWGPGVEEEEATQDLSAPAANHLWLWPEATHVTEERREGGRRVEQGQLLVIGLHMHCYA